MTGLKFAQCMFAALFLDGLCGAAAVAAEPDVASSRCFEIIVPQRQKQPDRPLLFNKCTGATWLLARTSKSNGESHGYRWVSLEMENPIPRSQAVRVSPPTAPQATLPTPGEPCFNFVGRRFCE